MARGSQKPQFRIDLHKLPPTSLKFFNISPEAAKAIEAKRIMHQSEDDEEIDELDSSAAEEVETDVEEDEEDSKSKKKGKKRGSKGKKPATKRAKRSESSEPDESPEPEEISFYPVIIVPSKQPPQTRSRRSASASKPPPPEEHQCSPFFVPVNIAASFKFEAFLEELAKSVERKTENLVLSEIEWRFEKPKSSAKKLVRDIAGFKGMMNALKERKKDRVVIITMPPPKLASNREPWEQDSDDEFEPKQTPLTEFQAQKMNIDRMSEPHRLALLDRYPKDNHAAFPGKRIYAKDGRFWELNELCLGVWSVALGKGTPGVDINNPPNSAHFDAKKAIKPPAASSTTADAAQAPPIMPGNHSSLDLYGGMLMNLMYRGLPGMPYPYPPPGYPLAANGTSAHPAFFAQPQPSTSTNLAPINNSYTKTEPSLVRLPWGITLDHFCDYYSISAADKTKLEKLEVELGDRQCEELDEDTWKTDGGFSKLGWNRFKAKHACFCRNIESGLWSDGVPKFPFNGV